MSQSVAYLGAPYTHPDANIRAFRERAVTLMAYKLFNEGHLVYSPLTHNIPIDALGFFGDWNTWKNFDHTMLLKCDKLFVLKLPDWEKSKGLEAEMNVARSHNIPIEYLEPDHNFLAKVSELRIEEGRLTELSNAIEQTMVDRDWVKFNSPKNIAMSLNVEAGELADHFVWLSEKESYTLPAEALQAVSEEVGDVFINLLQMCRRLDIDLFDVTEKKLEEIKKRYPAEKAKLMGSSNHIKTFSD